MGGDWLLGVVALVLLGTALMAGPNRVGMVVLWMSMLNAAVWLVGTVGRP